MKADPSKLRTAALFGFLAVALGAMGAHGLRTSWEAEKGLVEAAKLLEVWKTASLYHVVHAVVLLILAYVFSERTQGRWVFASFVWGTLLFSGSLYGICAFGLRWLGPVTPIGGLLLMLGWLLLVVRTGPKTKSV